MKNAASWYPSAVKDRRSPFTTTLPVETIRGLAVMAKAQKTTKANIVERVLRAYFEVLRANPPKNS